MRHNFIIALTALLLFSACDKTPQPKWGVLKIKKVEVIEEIDSVGIEGVSIGLNAESLENLKSDVREFNRGKFNDEFDLLQKRIFPGYFDSPKQMLQFFDAIQDNPEKMKFNLKNQEMKYVSRAVEVDNFLVFALENYVHFDLILQPGYEGAYKSAQSDLVLQYGRDYVTFNEEKATFTVDGSHVLYALTPKDTAAFMFCNELMMHDKKMRKFVDDMEFSSLRYYFDEISIYQ